MKPTITLKDATAKAEAPRTRSLADFLSEDELEELHRINYERRLAKKPKKFDEVDSIVAEIIARFGWEVYQKWNDGEIDMAWMTRIINAERARDARKMAELEGVVVETLKSLNSYDKKGKMTARAKKTAKDIEKIIKQNSETARGY